MGNSVAKPSKIIYTGSATIGRVYSTFSSISLTVFCVPMIIIGIFLLTRKDLYTRSVNGIVGSSICSQNTQNHNTVFDCSLEVNYKVFSKDYNKKFAIDSGIDYEGYKTINVYYNPHDPNDSVIQKPPLKELGWSLIIIFLVLLIFTWSWTIIGYKYKPVAALTGVGDILNVL